MDIDRKTDLRDLTQVLNNLGVADCDYALFGDGSGSGWDLPVGWGCVLVEVATGRRKSFYGMMSSGCVTIAEAMPYLQAAVWLREYRKRRGDHGVARVCVVTDLKNLADAGEDLAAGHKSVGDTGVLMPFWAGLLSLERCGLSFAYRAVPRASLAVNCWADGMSKVCFKAAKEVGRPEGPDGVLVSPYDCNPNPDDHNPLLAWDPRPRRPRRPKGRPCPPGDDLPESALPPYRPTG